MSNFKNTQKMKEIYHFISDILIDPSQVALAATAGYSKKELDNMLALYNELVELRQLREVSDGRKQSAREGVRLAKVAIKKHYAPIVTIARALFKGNVEASNILDLKGERSKAFDDITSQLAAFYKMGMENSEIAAKFKKRGITEEWMKKGQDLFVDMLALKRIQEVAKRDYSASLKAIRVKNKELEKWYAEAKNVMSAWQKIELSKEEG